MAERTSAAQATERSFSRNEQDRSEDSSNEDAEGSAEGSLQDEDLVSPLSCSASQFDFEETHSRKRSVLKRSDRPKTPSSLQKRVSFSTTPSKRRVSNGM